MKSRPLSITILGYLFVAIGIIGVVFHATEFKASNPFRYDALWACLVQLVAFVSGVCMLRGKNWARWLGLVWIAGHVILSAFDSPFKLLVHGLLFAAFAYFLLRRQAAHYFRPARTESSAS